MQLHSLVVIFTALLATLSLTLAKAWPANTDFSDYDSRQKRQTHPDSTVAILEGEEPLPYLVPPADPGDPAAPAPSDQPWALGYDAGEVLVPPPLPSLPGTYRTMKAEEEVGRGPEEPEPITAASADDFASAPALGPRQVYSFVQTDKDGHFKWGVSHHAV